MLLPGQKNGKIVLASPSNCQRKRSGPFGATVRDEVKSEKIATLTSLDRAPKNPGQDFSVDSQDF